jgi:hypothetical protein
MLAFGTNITLRNLNLLSSTCLLLFVTFSLVNIKWIREKKTKRLLIGKGRGRPEKIIRKSMVL